MLDVNPNEDAARGEYANVGETYEVTVGITSTEPSAGEIPTVAAFMDAVVPWPGSSTDPGWVIMPNGYVDKRVPGGRNLKTGKYPIGPGKAFKDLTSLLGYINWAN